MKKLVVLVLVTTIAFLLQVSVLAASGDLRLLPDGIASISSVPLIEGGLFLDNDTSSSATASEETLQNAV